jgi:hypothetical protein
MGNQEERAANREDAGLDVICRCGHERERGLANLCNQESEARCRGTGDSHRRPPRA